jgi:chemotaxis protein MotA
MIIAIGLIIVFGSVMGGFIMAGGYMKSLMHISELVIIGGAALGSIVIMAPKKVLMDMIQRLIGCLKGAPHDRRAYEELFMMLYEVFLMGRRNGLIALEEHVGNPQSSAVFQKYPNFLSNHHAVEFLCSALRPIIDGKIKPDQLKQLLETDLEHMEEEAHAPVSVLTKASDAMPGFGIVAAVLGIIITMAGISGPIEKIGEKVATALVGTFLGIFLAYGIMNPLAVNMDFNGSAKLSYFRCIAVCVVGFAGGMAPGMAVEVGRRGLSEELRPTADELEAMTKSLGMPGKK